MSSRSRLSPGLGCSYIAVAGLALLTAACSGDSDDASGSDGITGASAPTGGATQSQTTSGTDNASSAGPTAGAETDGASGSTGALETSGTDPIKYDVAGAPDGGSGSECGLEPHVPCDAGASDPFQAMGLNCPGEGGLQVAGETTYADPLGLTILSSFGEGDTYLPTEGSSYAVLSTGEVAQLFDAPDSPGDAAFHCNSWLPADGMDTTSFPPPIVKNEVAGDCLQDPGLVGTGDCSNTIKDQFDQSGFKYDYQELRLSATVPEGASSLSFDVAFMTKEYPIWLDKPYNDMFIAWLESSAWTGNISFDPNGEALSLNAAFFEFFDEAGDLPQFSGTCMRYSAGTPWLTTSVSVVAGETIELVFAVFDVEDVNWDSVVLLDNVRWGCDEIGEPVTEPPQ